MSIFERLQQTLQYVWEGASRIFSPNHDEYPNSGVQPYEGDPPREHERL